MSPTKKEGLKHNEAMIEGEFPEHESLVCHVISNMDMNSQPLLPMIFAAAPDRFSVAVNQAKQTLSNPKINPKSGKEWTKEEYLEQVTLSLLKSMTKKVQMFDWGDLVKALGSENFLDRSRAIKFCQSFVTEVEVSMSMAMGIAGEANVKYGVPI